MRVIFRCMTNRDAGKIRSCIQGRGVSRPRSEGGGGGGGGPNGIGQRHAPAPPPRGRAANKTKATAPAPAGRDGQQNRGGMPPRQNEKRTDRTAARLSEIKRYSVRPPGGGAGRSTKPGRHAAPAKRKRTQSDGSAFIRNQTDIGIYNAVIPAFNQTQGIRL